MPTYDYKCTKCGHTFEAFQRITEEPLSTCPKCKGAVKRLVGGGMGVIFKGSGFYTTDYKKSSALTSSNGGSKDKDKKTETAAPTEASAAKEAKPSEKKTAS